MPHKLQPQQIQTGYQAFRMRPKCGIIPHVGLPELPQRVWRSEIFMSIYKHALVTSTGIDIDVALYTFRCLIERDLHSCLSYYTPVEHRPMYTFIKLYKTNHHRYSNVTLSLTE